MSKWIIAVLMISASPLTFEKAYAQTEISDIQEINLADAIQKALAVSPASRIADATYEISKGERQQAGLIPNTELSFEAENIGGSGDFKGTDALETTISLSQTIEIGGKRSARIQMADEGINLGGYDAQSARLNLTHEVTLAYIEAVAAEEQVKIAQEQRKLAQNTLDVVAKRVDAAADPLFQKSKANVALSAAKTAVKQAETQARIAKQKLAGYWDGTASKIKLDHHFFKEIDAPRTYEHALSALKASPDYQRWNALHAQGRAAIDFEKSQAIPDPTVNVGVRDFRENEDQAFVVGVSVPFAVFNRNQGNIHKASHMAAKIDAERQQAWRDLELSLSRLIEEEENNYLAAQMIEQETLPAAQKAFSEARKGHSAGKFAYLEVLDAQRTLADIREEYNNTLKQYHMTRADIDRLTSQGMSSGEHKNEK